MKINFFIGGLSGGGAERVICNLSNYLYNKGHTVTILTMADDQPSYSLDDGVRRIALLNEEERRGFIYNSCLRLWRFCKYLKQEKTDVYVVMLPVTIIMMLVMRWLIKGKIIASERNSPSTYARTTQRLLKFLAKQAEGWVFQTKEEYEWYGRVVKKGIIIPNAINPDFIKPVYTGVRKKTIVTVGRMTEQKNQALLIRAFAEVVKDFPLYNLKIYGDGEKRDELIILSEKLGLVNNIEFPGYLKNIGEHIKDSSLFVLSSDFEGMPNALMEAMALGLPCISTDCDGGGAKFLIENGKNGMLVPKGDAEILADAMRKMLSDKAFAEQCGQEAHKIVTQLEPHVIYSKWESFINDVLKAK